MPAILDEHNQWLDAAGKPLVNGKVYFGDQNADPVANPQTIYSDRALTTPIANPQTLNANGRTVNKVWIAGPYSIRADTSADVQVYQNLDNGEELIAGAPISLTNVSGSNAITATDPGGAASYVDLQKYVLRSVLANTGAMTININGIGAVSIRKNHDQQILAGEVQALQNIELTYNATENWMSWTNPNDRIVAFTRGNDVASATTTDIWQLKGNNIHITGVQAISSFGTARQAGEVRWAIIDDVLDLVHSSNLQLPGNVDYKTEAGDLIRVYADTTTQHIVAIFPVSGRAVSATEYLQIEDRQTDGTDGGASVASAWTARVLNTIVLDTGNIASLSVNQITLPAGTYELEATAPFYATNGTRMRFQNVTDGTTVAISPSAEFGATVTNQGYLFLTVRGRFTITATKGFELQYYATTAFAGVGLGKNDGQVLGDEVYARVVLHQVA